MANWFNRWKNKPAIVNEGTTDQKNPARWLIDWVRGGDESDSGITISERTALAYTSVWHAVNIIAGDLGQLPLCVYRYTPDGRERDTKHAAYKLLKYRPNPWMNASTFRETMQAHVLLRGNARAGIVRDANAAPVMIVPFLPDRTETFVSEGRIWHRTRIGTELTERIYPDRDVLHIKGLGYDGVNGYDVLTFAKNSIGLGIAGEKRTGKNFKQASAPGVVLETPNTFTREAALELLGDWERMNTGLDNSGRTALLQRGTTAKTLSLTGDQMQLLEQRAFQRVEIAGWFSLPPHKLGDSSKVAYNSLEQENQSYLNSCLMRWLIAWQEECREKLLREDEKESDSHYIEFITAALLRGDLLSRYRAYQIGVAGTWLCPDEVREFENMNKRPDGLGGVFQNPNTTSNKPADENEETDEETDEPEDEYADEPKDDKAAKAVAGRLAAMIRIECKRVKASASMSKNFVAWLDTFYDKWQTTLGSVVEELGGDCELALAHCQYSRDQLLTLCDTATSETLAGDVSRLVSNWEQRADTLAQNIMEIACATS